MGRCFMISSDEFISSSALLLLFFYCAIVINLGSICIYTVFNHFMTRRVPLYEPIMAYITFKYTLAS